MALGNGDGTFGAYQTWATPAELNALANGTNESYQTKIVDMDGDGRDDLFVTVTYYQYFRGTYILYSNGSGFDSAEAWLSSAGLSATPFRCTLAELNGDGLIDCAEYQYGSNHT